MIQLQAFDYFILTVYFIFVLGIGWRLRRQVQTGADSLTSWRKIPVWIARLAFLSVNLGAQEVIGRGACGARYVMLTCHLGLRNIGGREGWKVRLGIVTTSQGLASDTMTTLWGLLWTPEANPMGVGGAAC